MTRIRTIVAAAAALAMLAAARPAAAQERPEQVWLVSTRQAPLSCPADDVESWIQYWQFGQDGAWLPSEADTFRASDDPASPTVFFVHGNRADRQTAINDGWAVYRSLDAQAAGRPFRFVIWSWPADQIAGPNRQDVQVKAWRSDGQAWYLAQFLRKINPKTPVSMIGYSFGARAITGALHLLSGGQIQGRTLGEDPAGADRVPYRAALLAAALDNDWLLPSRRNGLALGRVDHLLVTQNTCDPVLRWYPMMYRLHGPEALGYLGPACPTMLGADQSKLEVVNVNCTVGQNHDWGIYIHSSSVQSRLAWYAFLAPEAAESESPKPAPTQTSAEAQLPTTVAPTSGG